MTGIAALVLGIAAMVLVFAPKLKLWGFLLGVIAAVIGILAKGILGWIGCISGIAAIILVLTLLKKKQPIKAA